MTQPGTETGFVARTILVVDHDYDSRMIYSCALRTGGFAVLLATNGSEALDIMPGQTPHAIVTELGLPILDGRELVQHLKQDPSTASIPVIVVTTFVDPQHRREAEDAGCDLFLRKPCPPRDLMRAVCQLLNRPLPSEIRSEHRVSGDVGRASHA
jgi:CheY-like chemotaxis protein